MAHLVHHTRIHIPHQQTIDSSLDLDTATGSLVGAAPDSSLATHSDHPLADNPVGTGYPGAVGSVRSPGSGIRGFAMSQAVAAASLAPAVEVLAAGLATFADCKVEYSL